MTRRKRRLAVIGVAGFIAAASMALVLSAMRDTIVFFRSPADVVATGIAPGVRFRLGGLVETSSVARSPGQIVEFKVGDGSASIPVRFKGLLPDLFREGQGVVVEGSLAAGGIFVAETVLARHDESYMPREVAEALKAQGRWQGTLPQRTSQR